MFQPLRRPCQTSHVVPASFATATRLPAGWILPREPIQIITSDPSGWAFVHSFVFIQRPDVPSKPACVGCFVTQLLVMRFTALTRIGRALGALQEPQWQPR